MVGAECLTADAYSCVLKSSTLGLERQGRRTHACLVWNFLVPVSLSRMYGILSKVCDTLVFLVFMRVLFNLLCELLKVQKPATNQNKYW